MFLFFVFIRFLFLLFPRFTSLYSFVFLWYFVYFRLMFLRTIFVLQFLLPIVSVWFRFFFSSFYEGLLLFLLSLFLCSFYVAFLFACRVCHSLYPALHPFSFLLLSLVCLRFCSFFHFCFWYSFNPVCCVLFCVYSFLPLYFCFYFLLFGVIFRLCLVFPRCSFLSHFSLPLFVFVERVAFLNA